MKEKIKNFVCNKNFTGVIRAIIVFSAFALILQIVSGGAFSKVDTGNMKNKYSGAYSFLSEPDNSIDVVCIGNSDIYSAFVPAYLWDNYGYTSTVIGSPRQTTLRSYMIMQDLLEKQSPKVMIIETDMLYDEEDDKEIPEENDKNENVIKRTILTVTDEEKLKEVITSKFTVFLVHDHWKNLTLDNLKNAFKSDKAKTVDHGYNFSNDIVEVEPTDYMKKTDEVKHVRAEHKAYLDDMVKLCRENNIEVVFAQVPSVNSWSYAKHNAAQQLADSYGVKFIDFNLLTDEIGLNWKTDFRDEGNHLNYDGALKTTAYFAEFIRNEYSDVLTDRRNDSTYDYWHSYNDEFYKIHEITDEYV